MGPVEFTALEKDLDFFITPKKIPVAKSYLQLKIVFSVSVNRQKTQYSFLLRILFTRNSRYNERTGESATKEKNPRNYSSMKLELLALKWAVTVKFRTYLLCSKFEVYTDNNALNYVLTTAKLGALEQRWAAQLALFYFTISCRSRRSSANADALSRQPHGTVPDDTEDPKDNELNILSL